MLGNEAALAFLSCGGYGTRSEKPHWYSQWFDPSFPLTDSPLREGKSQGDPHFDARHGSVNGLHLLSLALRATVA